MSNRSIRDGGPALAQMVGAAPHTAAQAGEQGGRRLAQAIIPMAGRATRLAPLLGGRPKSLVRVAGRPLLIWTMTQLIEQGVERFVLVVGVRASEQIRAFLQHSFTLPSVEIVLVEQTEQLGPGHALACAAPVLQPGRALVVLGDTFFNEVLPAEGDWVGVARVAPGRQWCLVETDAQAQVRRFYDKCAAPEHVSEALVGLYHFDDADLLGACLADAIASGQKIQNEFQISAVLERYHQQRPLHAHTVTSWHDCGTVTNLAAVKRDLFNTRAPNRITINPLGILTKHSSSLSLADQIAWYQELDGPRALLAPRLVEANTAENYYRLEYVHLDSLADLYLYEALTVEECGRIFTSVIETLQRIFWPLPAGGPGTQDLQQRCREMYIHKMQQRFGAWERAQEFLQIDTVEVNGRPVAGVRRALDFLSEQLEEVARTPIPGFIHGDLHFSNLLYACDLDYFRLIDPRGNFAGPPAKGGDVRYELGKLRHSYHGLYDAIINDLFDVRELSAGRYQLDLALDRSAYAALLDRRLEALGYDLRAIALIEAGLFLSMLPLHADYPRRQIAFLLIALQMAAELMEPQDRLGGGVA